MRTNEERIHAMHMRAEVLVEADQNRKIRMIQTAAVFLSLVLLITLASFMPGIMGTINWNTALWQMTGSIFAGSAALGYIVIAIIAFLLGVSITIFCFKLKARQSKKDEGRSQ